MHLRPHAVSAGSVACRVVDSPVGTLDARSCHALDSHGSPHNAAVPGLEVSRGDVLQHQLIQAQLCYQPLQLRVLLLPAPSAAVPGPPANRHTLYATGSRSAPRFPLPYTLVASSFRSPRLLRSASEGS